MTFIVEGKKFYAHKIVLSLISEHFRGMFKSGMAESKMEEIVIDDVTYPVFNSIMYFLYTGEFHFGADWDGQESSIDHLHEFLRISDKYMLEDVKIECEVRLKNMMTDENLGDILTWAETYNADNLRDYCIWYRTNKSS